VPTDADAVSVNQVGPVATMHPTRSATVENRLRQVKVRRGLIEARLRCSEVVGLFS
jgi:hypothetical protein